MDLCIVCSLSQLGFLERCSEHPSESDSRDSFLWDKLAPSECRGEKLSRCKLCAQAVGLSVLTEHLRRAALEVHGMLVDKQK